MNSPRVRGKASQPSNARCTDLATLAERELSAFFRAVTELFGSEQAQLSAEEWLRELSDAPGLPGSSPEFRAITTRVLVRLAKRVRSSFSGTELQTA